LTDGSPEGADAKLRELQRRVRDIELEVRPGKWLRLAASAGASVFPRDGTTYETLLADADQKMYRDKAARRQRLAIPRAPGADEFVDADLDVPVLAGLRLPLPQTLA
jgi:GGDEF domain-containing protein